MIEVVPIGDLQWGLLAVNTVGSALMGFLFGGPLVDEIRSELRLAATSGFCGSLTTLSGFSLVTAGWLRDGDVGSATAFVLISLTAGVGAAWVARRFQGATPH
jgi:CrcB protein